MIESFLTVGRQIITLYLLMAAGYVLGKVKLIDDRGSLCISNLVMYVVSPCMMLVAFQRPLEHELLHEFVIMLGVALLLHAAFIVLSRLLIREKDAHRRSLLLFGSVFTNCGFMGYPLMAALFGTIGVFYGSAYVVVFTFLSWTYGIYAMTGDRSQLKLRPLLMNPGVISIVLAMALFLLQITLPEILMVPITYLADLNTPLPMVVVGYQLSHADFRAALRGVGSWVSLLLRLVAFPLLTPDSHHRHCRQRAPRRPDEHVLRQVQAGHGAGILHGIGTDGVLRPDHAADGEPCQLSGLRQKPEKSAPFSGRFFSGFFLFISGLFPVFPRYFSGQLQVFRAVRRTFPPSCPG